MKSSRREVASAIKPDDSGQVLVLTALILLGLVACVVAVADIGELVVEKVRLQGAADAGATAGAAAVADTLNALSVSNLLIVAATASSVVSGGEAALAVKALERTQAGLIKGGGAMAAGLACKAALESGARRALPWNRGSSGSYIRPDLMVAQESRMWLIVKTAAASSGLVTVDKFRTTESRPYGERYVLMGAMLDGGRVPLLSRYLPLLGRKSPMFISTGEAAVSGGRVWFQGLLKWPYPGYRSSVVAISSRHKGASVRH